MSDVVGERPVGPLTGVPGGLPPRGSRLVAVLRAAWRALTSMRVALVLLFLLALAALPGALLPQRSLNAANVERYLVENPVLGPWLARLGFFEVFASPWFAAIYLLLFVSLLGCLLPRTFDYARSLTATPVATPRNLGRLPHAASGTLDASVDAVLDRVRGLLRGWRVAVREEPGGVRTVSAERGYLRETGNLIFHLSLIGLLIGFAAGKLYGYEGQVIVPAAGGQFCNTGILGYDSFRAGLLVDGTQLDPFCVRVDDFTARYQANGQPISYRADLGYQSAEDLAAGAAAWRRYPLEVNHPLRLDGSRVYLLGHGYAPVFTVTYPDGKQRTGDVQWRPVDGATLLSEGATKFSRPGAARHDQLAITGLLAPTSSGGPLVTSVFPDLRDPRSLSTCSVATSAWTTAAGSRSSRCPSGRWSPVRWCGSRGRTCVPGAELRLADGTTIRFDEVRRWVSLQVSNDPGQLATGVFAVLVLLGLGLSLFVKRRRFWVRLVPAGGADRPDRTVVQVGGLARTDRAGYGEEFDSALVGPAGGRPAEGEVDARAVWRLRLPFRAGGVPAGDGPVRLGACRSTSTGRAGAGLGRRSAGRRHAGGRPRPHRPWHGPGPGPGCVVAGRSGRADGVRADDPRCGAVGRLDPGPRHRRAALAVGQHVRVHRGALPDRGGRLADRGAPHSRATPDRSVPAGPGGRVDVPRRHRAVRPGRAAGAGAAVVLDRDPRQHDRDIQSGCCWSPGWRAHSSCTGGHDARSTGSPIGSRSSPSRCTPSP